MPDLDATRNGYRYCYHRRDGEKTIFVSSALIANQALNYFVFQPPEVPFGCDFIIKERTSVDPDPLSPPFSRRKTEKAPSTGEKRSQKGLGQDSYVLRGLFFTGHDASGAGNKNLIFLNSLLNTT